MTGEHSLSEGPSKRRETGLGGIRFRREGTLKKLLSKKKKAGASCPKETIQERGGTL